MTLKKLIDWIDAVKPNAYTEDQKTQWVNEIEGMVQTEVFLIAIEDVIQYVYTADQLTELLVSPPHDKLYRAYLTAMIDFHNGEYDKYQNSMQLFNSFYGEFVRWFARVYRPAQRREERGNG